MTKKELGKQIKALRQECGVSTYKLEQKGIHPNLPTTIENGEKGYTIDSLIKYLNAIHEDIVFSVGKREKNKGNLTKKEQELINKAFQDGFAAGQNDAAKEIEKNYIARLR